MAENHQVSIKWDFTQDSKDKYFEFPISGLGQDLFLSFQDSCRSFWEICTIVPTNICICEAYLEKPMLISKAEKPFIYIKNIGTSDLNLIGSSLSFSELSCYSQNKFDDVLSGAACNYLISPNESLFLTLKSSTDGSSYYSVVQYPFGFYYDFDNINEINKIGSHTICCGNNGFPTYTYEQIFDFDDSFSFCETNPNEQIYSTQYFLSGNFELLCDSQLARINCHPQTTGKWSLYSYKEGLKVCPNFLISGEVSDWPLMRECSYYSGNMFSVFGKSGEYKISIISGYIRPEKFPDSGNYASVFTIKNINNGEDYYVDFSCSGSFEHLNLDLFRIDSEGYVHAGTSTNFYDICQNINGFCFVGDMAVRTGSFDFDFSFNFNMSFLLEPTQNVISKQLIFGSECFRFYIQDCTLVYEDCYTNLVSGLTIETGKLTCIFIEKNTSNEICITKSDPCCLCFLKYDNSYDVFLLCQSAPFFELCCISNVPNFCNSNSNYFSIGGNWYSDIVQDFFCGKIIDFCISVSSGTGYIFCLDFLNYESFDYMLNFMYASTGGLTYIPSYTGYQRRVVPQPRFESVKSECPLILNQWNDYCIEVKHCNYIAGPNEAMSILLQSNSLGSSFRSWSYTFPQGNEFLPYRIPTNISGLSLNQSEICDLYYLEISSLNNEKSEFFCGGLSDVTYFSEFRDSSFGLIYDDYLYIDFDFKCKNFIGKKHSLYFNHQVDSGVNLTLSASGKTNGINYRNKIYSLYGGNCYEGIIDVCGIYLHNESGLLTGIKLNENYTGNNFFESSVTGDCFLCLFYDINYLSGNKFYRYLYCSNTPNFSSKQCFVCNFFGISTPICFNNQLELSGNLLYELTGNSDSCIFVDLNLQNDFSLKTVSGLNWKKCSMFLPPINCLPYCYCFQISNANNLPNASNGFWTQNQTGLLIEQYINYTEIVSISDQDYINCGSQIYDMLINVSESRSKISDLQSKNEDSLGEPFLAVFDLNQESFFYSGIEYRYNPVCSVIFRCNEYIIPNICMNMQVFSSGNSISFDFPIRALNQDKIKIIAESQTIELVSKAQIDLDYSGFQMQFSCYNSNYNEFKIPKICSGSASPDLSIEIYPCSMVENCINFYIDPYLNFKDDLTYGMNNFLFFIASQLNSGLVYCCNFSGFDYGTSDYNFLMVDLKNEFYDCCYLIPSGTEKFLINSIISFENLDSQQPLLYKSISGNGYSYIVPVPTGLIFSDCTNNCIHGLVCNECFVNKTLKNITTGFQYSGGSNGYFYTGSGALTDEILNDFLSGNGGDFYSGFLLNSCFCYLNNSYILNINNQEINQTQSGKSICFNKKYTFSGVQPVILYSNYPLQEIKNNLVLTNLTEYCSSAFESSGVFYYTYDITKSKRENIKFLSPDFTYIQYVNWTDDRGDCNYLCFLYSDNNFGQIQKNAASIRYEVTGLVQNNRYFYSLDEAETICFIIREDL